MSQEFYAESTHFLHELVQNADDNAYNADCTPALHIEYEDGLLLVRCNEVGFSRQNVEAICAIGRSSKGGRDHRTDMQHRIGEKGVGFKSVFKIADVVWIKSGYYSFKLDKSQPLGMITPLREQFPKPRFARGRHSHVSKACRKLRSHGAGGRY